MTINELLTVIKAVRERINDLKELRKSSAVKETYFSQKEKTIEPLYDVRLVDRKIVELQNFCSLVDAKIKASNAVTNINVAVDMEKMLEPLK